jgi:poly(hydroxyalkanoate) granule-associated protein
MPSSKHDKNQDPSSGAADLRQTVQDSAQQIWLAGLGAFAKAQAEGGKVFETLVREGSALQQRTQSGASERLAEAAERMNTVASEFSQRAAGQWGKLEGLFEERVDRALRALGVPTAAELQALQERVAVLEARLADAPAAAPRKKARSASKATAAPAASTPAPRRARKPTNPD